jgi:hypothetical protein
VFHDDRLEPLDLLRRRVLLGERRKGAARGRLALITSSMPPGTRMNSIRQP